MTEKLSARDLFKKAHSITRKLVTKGILYGATFALVLRDIARDGIVAVSIRVMNLEARIARIRAEEQLAGFPAIVGVSDRQAAYATEMRLKNLPSILAELVRRASDAKTDAERDLVARTDSELRTNATAKFWLDVVRGSGQSGLLDAVSYVRRQTA